MRIIIHKFQAVKIKFSMKKDSMVHLRMEGGAIRDHSKVTANEKKREYRLKEDFQILKGLSRMKELLDFLH